MLAYNEKSGVEFEASFFDADGNPTPPGAVMWRLDCETSQTVLRDFTSVDWVESVGPDGQPIYTALIEVPGSLNAIQKNGNAQELKKLLVVANKDQDDEYSEEYRYTVRNLRGRS